MNIVSKIKLLTIFLFILLPISFRPLFDNNEGFYAKIAKEMVESGNFLVPCINGLIYIEKPPLFYWLVCLSYYLFGINEFAARLPSAIAAFGLLLILNGFVRRYEQGSDNSVFILATSIGFFIMSQQVMTDMVFTLFNTACLLYFWSFLEKRKTVYLYLSFISAGLASLTKGLIGIVLPFFIGTVFILIERKQMILKLTHILKGFFLFLIIFLPWHVYMSFVVKDFFWEFFLEEHFFRFLGQRAPHDYYTRPPYYILSVLFLGMLPWTHILVSLFGSIKRLRALQLYLVIWITIFFVFFTISRCASSYYMLPCYPALSILIGLNINQSVKTKFIKGVFITFTVFAFIASLLMLFLKKDDPILIYGRPYVIMNIIFYGIFCVISFYHYIRQNLTHMIRYGFFMLAVFVFTSLVFFNTHEGAFSSRSIALELKKVYKTEDMVFMMTRYEDYSSFPFYLNQYVFLLERVQKDLDYGIKKEKEKKVFFKMDEFLKLAETKTVYLFLKDKDYRGNISLNRFWIFAKCEEKLLITNAKKIKN